MVTLDSAHLYTTISNKETAVGISKKGIPTDKQWTAKESSAVHCFLELSPSIQPYHRRSDHLPRLAEAAAGPEDVVLVLVAAPVGVGSGSAASAVLCEGGGGIDLSHEKKKCCSKDVSCFFRRMGELDRSALFMKGLHSSSGYFRFISLPIQG